jgi:hypothetical protein
MTHAQRLEQHPTYETVPGYWRRHKEAFTYAFVPSKPKLESGIAMMLHGWVAYADAHKAAYESGIGEDGVLGPEWRDIGLSLLGLLNGDLGRLDGGALDAAIRGSLEAEGFNPDV